MRKVTAGLFHSVDGVVEAPNEWQFDAFDAELGETLTQILGRVDTVLMGRIGYEQWAAYWPTTENDEGFAQFINTVPKFVASRTLGPDLAWQNASLIEGDLLDFVKDHKSRPGGEIAVMGGISLVRQLLFAGLLDELSLITHPVIAGKGQHLFRPEDPVTRLALQDSMRTSKGNMVLTYGLRPA